MKKISFGKYLEWMRKELKLTQQQLADMVNCAISTISRIESGKDLVSRRIFNELNRIFESMGLIYDEIWMESIFEFKRARKELMDAIKKGRLEELERKMDIFKNLMEKHENDSDAEDIQYYVLGHLISTRKQGLTIEAFLEEAIKIFEIRRKIPRLEDISKVYLTQIEYQLLYYMAEAYMVKGDLEQSELIFKGLISNEMDERSPMIQERYVELSSALAKICIAKKEYGTAKECLAYVFNEYLQSNDTRTLFNNLVVHGELCSTIGDFKGARLIDNFLQATQNLMGHMQQTYQLKKDVEGRLL
ncbi:Helix-turn-helix domain-containing protein [Pseudobutyrivibrio sp. YE44]|uniref:helix-turn-helix domain-containing protein n=1 Tax=Pseudobutyrivibrio sp. YE44 TaxID=1520802 RepID=UPI0008828A91|nr:helix-turn-helix transcriptional regulator [Pseudobutyrivibrio sp. YE44]SDB51383.1 Helix-turn-helix domain-containing protein [Pseudobutyrivibrio sp. YE44]